MQKALKNKIFKKKILIKKVEKQAAKKVKTNI